VCSAPAEPGTKTVPLGDARNTNSGRGLTTAVRGKSPRPPVNSSNDDVQQGPLYQAAKFRPIPTNPLRDILCRRFRRWRDRQKHKKIIRMWADAQSDGRPASARVPCSNAANIEHKTWTHSEFCHLLGGKSSRKCVYGVPARETAKHRATFR